MIGALVIMLDPSVIESWYLETPSSARASSAVPDENAVYAGPDFLIQDMAEKLHASGAYTVVEVQAILDRLRADLVLEPVTFSMIKAAMAWMFHYDLPLRRLLPLAMAREAAAPLLTTDKDLVETLKAKGATDLLRDVVLLA